MAKDLVLLGGGHAHMVALSRLREFRERGHKITVVQPAEHHYYSGMGPGMLSRIYSPEEIRFHTKVIVEKQGGRFLLDRADTIQAEQKMVRLASGQSLPYDVLSCNVGSSVASDLAGSNGDVFPVKPIASLLNARQRVLEAASTGRLELGVVGGGPAAMEIAGNVRRLLGDEGSGQYQVRIFAGRRFLARLPRKVRMKAGRKLAALDIQVLEEGYVHDIQGGEVRLENGAVYPADMVFLATGVRPSGLFSRSDLAVGPDGGLQVNRYLQHVEHPEIFGGGDCIYFQDQPLDKVGVYAVRQNPVLADNLLSALEGRPLSPFEPGGDYMLIYNLGDGTGLLHKGWLTLNGRLAFRIKDSIDRKFMRRFQAMEAG